jgi:hypothetical protein
LPLPKILPYFVKGWEQGPTELQPVSKLEQHIVKVPAPSSPKMMWFWLRNTLKKKIKIHGLNA